MNRASEITGYQVCETGWRSLLWIAILSIVLLWPAILNGGPLLFYDSAGYYEGGRRIVGFLKALLGLRGHGAADAEGGPGPEEEAVGAIRSLAYSLLVYSSSATPAGIWGAVWVQALAASIVLERLLRGVTTIRLLSIAMLVGLTGIAWYASFLMPDIYAGLLLAVVLIVVMDAERIAATDVLVLGLVCLIGNAVHYGHPPLALGLGLTALGVLGWLRRLRWPLAALLLGPATLALLAHFVGSALVFEKPSAAPKRLPILLARSIEDGPARWHLEAHCADYRYAICELFDTFPDRASNLLFGPTGIGKRATPEQMDRIRTEESLILRRTFRDYPLTQARDTLDNVLTQMVRIGTDDFRWGAGLPDADGKLPGMPQAGDRDAWTAIALIHHAVVFLSALAIVAFALRDRLAGPNERAMVAIVLLGLLLNAAIFGGLSAPADRYQGRVIWILPALALILWARRWDRPAA